MTLVLRYMRLADIPQVVVIDQLSFNPPWSARSYAYEISESNYSHMVSLEFEPDLPSAPVWKRWLRGSPDPTKRIAGYGGLWSIADEAHISTIATHPDFRGRGWGEILLAGMVQKAITLKSAYLVLEVRVSNTVAQNLYHKYEFQIVDRKKGYYHTDGEDAFDMRLDLSDAALIERTQERLGTLRTRIAHRDLYSASTSPR